MREISTREIERVEKRKTRFLLSLTFSHLSPSLSSRPCLFVPHKRIDLRSQEKPLSSMGLRRQQLCMRTSQTAVFNAREWNSPENFPSCCMLHSRLQFAFPPLHDYDNRRKTIRRVSLPQTHIHTRKHRTAFPFFTMLLLLPFFRPCFYFTPEKSEYVPTQSSTSQKPLLIFTIRH